MHAGMAQQLQRIRTESSRIIAGASALIRGMSAAV